MATARKQWFVWMYVFVVLTVVVQLFLFFDLNQWTRARDLIGPGAYSTGVVTEKFDLRVTN